MDRRAAADVELGRRRVNQALGAIRKASRALAQASERPDSFGVVEVRSDGDVDRAREQIALALGECGQVDVVLLVTPPTEPPHHSPDRGQGGSDDRAT